MIADAVKTGRLLSKNSRAQNVLYPGLLAVLAAYTQHASVLRMVGCYALILLLYAVAVNFNNITDLQTDKLNKRSENVLIDRKLSSRHVTIFIFLALLGALLLQSILRQPQSLMLAAVYVLLSYVYSDSFCNLKSRGLFGTVVLCMCYSVLPLLLGMVQGSGALPSIAWEVAGLSALSAAPLILAKDYKDYLGDKKTHKLTPLVRLGHKKLLVLVNCLLVLSVLVYATMAFDHNFSMSLMVLTVLTYVFLTRKLHADRGNPTRLYKLLLLVLLLAMPVTLLA